MSRLAPLRLVVWLPIVGVLMSSGLRAEDAQMDRVIQWADTTLAGTVAECRASGIAAAVISDGRVVFLKGYGRDGNKPVDPETTVFSLASIAKSFAATAVAQLLKMGRIYSLDDPANLYLVRMQLKNVGSKEVTARHLLDHRCGLDESLYGLETVVPVAVSLDAEAIRRRVPAQVCRPGDFGHLLLMGPVAPLAPEPPVCMIPVSSARQGLRIPESYRSRSSPSVLRPESNVGLVGWLVRQIPDTAERALRSRAQAWPL